MKAKPKISSTFHFLILLLSFSVFALTIHPVPAQIWTSPVYLDTIRNPVPFIDPAMVEAKKIYNTTCWSCHGMGGKGDGPASIQMKIKPADHTSTSVLSQSDGALFWKISVGRGDMQPYSKLLTVKQRWALVNYIRSLSQSDGKTKLSQEEY